MSGREVLFGMDESFLRSAHLRRRPGPTDTRARYAQTADVWDIELDGRVYTGMMLNYLAATLQVVIRGRVNPESIMDSDGWQGYIVSSPLAGG